jgi:predicted aminopeptidase
VSSLCKKWNRAKLGLAESFQALEELSASASKEQIQEWEQQIKMANLNRATDLSAMDIYYIKVKEGKDQSLPSQKAISKIIASAETEKAIRLKLMTREQEGKVKPGLTGWVNSGIKIQEAQ